MKVAAYCRVSTDKEDQANSFESQQRYFRDYIERQPDWELYDVYADEGITGTSTKKRAAFNRMISDARLKRFDLIVTKEVSRFSRNILDTISYTRDLRYLGIGVQFMNDGINTLDPDSELRLSIMSGMAQEESRKTSSRVKWGQTRRMEQGVVFGRSMLGYDVKDGKMTLNPEGAEVVRLIFHKYVHERKGTTVIARELREAGYLTYGGNTKWKNTVILKILKNEKYCGDLKQKKTYTPDYLTHQKKYNYGAIITSRLSVGSCGRKPSGKWHAGTWMANMERATATAIPYRAKSNAVTAGRALSPGSASAGTAAATRHGGAALPPLRASSMWTP